MNQKPSRRERALEKLIEDAVDLVGECCGCLQHSSRKEVGNWWKRFEKWCPDSPQFDYEQHEKDDLAFWAKHIGELVAKAKEGDDQARIRVAYFAREGDKTERRLAREAMEAEDWNVGNAALAFAENLARERFSGELAKRRRRLPFENGL